MSWLERLVCTFETRKSESELGERKGSETLGSRRLIAFEAQTLENWRSSKFYGRIVFFGSVMEDFPILDWDDKEIERCIDVKVMDSSP